jgi:polygalacturonase
MMKQMALLLGLQFTIISCTSDEANRNNSNKIHFPEDIGFTDITTPPYNADNTGKSDVTSIIQKAIDDNSPMTWKIIYLPAGEYLVSDQLRWGDGHSN